MKSFTLIETLVAILVFTLAMGAVSGLILMAYRTQSYTWQQSIAIDEARRGIETMVKEIREAKAGAYCACAPGEQEAFTTNQAGINCCGICQIKNDTQER